MKQAPVRVRRKFDETFKREAVQNGLSSGKSAEVIAEERGLKFNDCAHESSFIASIRS